MVQWCVVQHQLDEAAAVAQRAMESFPNDADSARIAATVYRMSQKYDLAAEAARLWRQRSADNPEPADLMLADIELARGRAAAALSALKPYITAMQTNPQDDVSGIVLLARAKSSAGMRTMPLNCSNRSCRGIARGGWHG